MIDVAQVSVADPDYLRCLAPRPVLPLHRVAELGLDGVLNRRGSTAPACPETRDDRSLMRAPDGPFPGAESFRCRVPTGLPRTGSCIPTRAFRVTPRRVLPKRLGWALAHRSPTADLSFSACELHQTRGPNVMNVRLTDDLIHVRSPRHVRPGS